MNCYISKQSSVKLKDNITHRRKNQIEQRNQLRCILGSLLGDLGSHYKKILAQEKLTKIKDLKRGMRNFDRYLRGNN
jgi:hypothetical protein